MVFIHSLKDILSVKVKTRHDGFCDQFNRMFMTKLLLIMSIIMSFDYFADQISCIVDKNSKTNLEKDFIHSACWISGLYIYKVCNLQTRITDEGERWVLIQMPSVQIPLVSEYSNFGYSLEIPVVIHHDSYLKANNRNFNICKTQSRR